jgi:4-hydroxy-tetrahydrodipicolinate synthase
MSKLLTGVVPPVCTPFDSNFNVDEASLRKLINYQIDGGVHGLFILGSTSEVAYLTDARRAEVIRITMDEVKGRVPVVVGVIDTTTLRVIEHAKVAIAAGADGLVVTAPFYVRTHPKEIEEHFRLIRKACTDTFIYAYDIPVAVNGVKLDGNSLLNLAAEGVINGVKDSSGFDASMRALVIGREERKLKDFVVLTGSELTVDIGLIAGFDGVVPGFGNVDPAGYVRIYNYVKAGDYKAAKFEQERLFKMFELVNVGAPDRMGRASSAIGAFKESIHQLGIIKDPRTAPPQIALNSQEKGAITPYLVRGGLLKA